MSSKVSPKKPPKRSLHYRDLQIVYVAAYSRVFTQQIRSELANFKRISFTKSPLQLKFIIKQFYKNIYLKIKRYH